MIVSLKILIYSSIEISDWFSKMATTAVTKSEDFFGQVNPLSIFISNILNRGF
jgi:hypothetical protein